MDRAHRRELKHDKFVEQVGQTVEYAAEHRQQLMRWGGLALALLVLGGGVYLYQDRQHSKRQEALNQAIRTYDAQIAEAPQEFFVTFRTEAEKARGVEKAFTELIQKYDGSAEAAIAKYYLGAFYADKGKSVEAEKYLKQAGESGEAPYDSQAKFSLAQLYAAQNRTGEAEKLLRSVMEKPSIMVTKEQAAIELARVLAASKPEEARKLLEPLRAERSAVSRAAITALGEMAPKR
ncbi:MAG: tetratricopeptide repeat protein [Acidobacteria bacterium]|nr:tetratricopeptide repeat protein [Acidobacteriota bacterium]MBI3281454.1 tetratricopeptide repeat protein [Acidobacteriota bacterium]